MLKRIVWAAACLALAAGFVALVVSSLRSGLAAGKYGLAARAGSPGTYWFILTAYGLFAGAFLALAVKAIAPSISLRPLAIPALAVFLLMGIWMGVERIGALAGVVLEVADPTQRLIYGGLAITLVGVLGFVLYQMVWLELRDRWRRRHEARNERRDRSD